MARKLRPACARATLEILDRRDLFAADLAAANVLVLYNTSSADGAQIATDYAQVHPGVHLLGVNGVDPNNEDISADAYLSVIRPQVLAALTPAIDVIVTTKGLPLRVNVLEAEPAATFLNPLPSYVDPSGKSHSIMAWKPTSSLESELTTIDSVGMWQQMGDQSFQIGGNPTHNSYYGQTGVFSHAAFGMRLTARLDGYSVADVEAAIGRAQNATIGPPNSPTGPDWFMIDNDPNISYSPTMANLVNNVLTPAGMPTAYDNTTAFIGSAPGPVIGYDSQGVHSTSNPGANYISSSLNITLANGAVFNSWESFNAASFSPTGNTHGQGQVAQWLAKGGTAGVGNVAEPSAGTLYVVNEDKLFGMLLSGRTFAEAAWSSIFQLSYVTTVIGDPLMTWRPLPATSTVVGRSVFYNNSLWDGNDAAANMADDASIATDKTAYLAGSGNASFANITNYSKGINGLMIDLQGGGNHGAISMANVQNDFTFQIGNNNSPDTWSAAPSPSAILVRPAMGANGSDRVELIWPDCLIRNEWLKVTVKANADTGLANDDVFYFGNEVGYTGNSQAVTVATVGAGDIARTQMNFAPRLANIPITNTYDFNKDGQVSAMDVTIAQTHTTTKSTGLVSLNVLLVSSASISTTVAAAAPAAGSSDHGIESALSDAPASRPVGAATPRAMSPGIPGHLSGNDLHNSLVAEYFEQFALRDTSRPQARINPFENLANLYDLDAFADSLVTHGALEA